MKEGDKKRSSGVSAARARTEPADWKLAAHAFGFSFYEGAEGGFSKISKHFQPKLSGDSYYTIMHCKNWPRYKQVKKILKVIKIFFK